MITEGLRILLLRMRYAPLKKVIELWISNGFYALTEKYFCMAYEDVGKIVLIEFKTRGTFLQVPTRRIRLCFVKCAYSDLRFFFFS